MRTYTIRRRSDNHKETYDVYSPWDSIIAVVIVFSVLYAVVAYHFWAWVSILVFCGIIYMVVRAIRSHKNKNEGKV